MDTVISRGNSPSIAGICDPEKRRTIVVNIPKVSIGMPIYNGELFISETLDSLLAQTFTDYELIISDNASVDGTEMICRKYVANDKRIRYIRQKHNIGASANFRFVLDQAKGSFFMWSAADDVRSLDFVEVNVKFLEANPDYVASASPNCMEGQDPGGSCLVTFALEGAVEERFRSFFKNAWVSHGIFYSLIRTDVLRNCDVLGAQFLGTDWAINLYLASCGKIGRVDNGLTIFGARGVSKGPNAWSAFRTHPIGWVFPFYKLSIYSYRLASTFPFSERIGLIKTLLGLNIKSAIFQAWSELRALLKRVKRRVAWGKMGVGS